MTNVDLFEEASQSMAQSPHGAVRRHEPARREAQRTRRCGGRGPGEDRHYDLAMRAARRLPRTDRREVTARLICHHLRRMLEDEGRIAG